MRTLFFFACTAIFAISCNNSNDSATGKNSDSTKTAETKMEKPDYPYTPEHPHQDWLPGNLNHAATLMKGLKAWEKNDMTESAKYFGDTVDLRFDGFRAIAPHDSIVNILSMGRNQWAAVTIKMHDWESVISEDKKEEWVTIWYKQIMTDKAGKTDSMEVINDAKMQNGKVVLLSESVQHFPAPAKK